MYFENRTDAAHRLADALSQYREQKPLILAIPRGAVPMGRVLAQRLGGELDVVLVRKLGAPVSAELAVGAVDETGWTYIAPFAEDVGADASYLEEERRAQMMVMQRRRRLYTPERPPLDPEGRTVIVVDDGLATGATMVAALHSVRAHQPARLVCAVPVASQEGLDTVRPHADEVVCLLAPQSFGAVGQFYRVFDQVDDSEVVDCLRQ